MTVSFSCLFRYGRLSPALALALVRDCSDDIQEQLSVPPCEIDEQIVDHCPSYCSGHGTCHMTSAPHCICETGWTGSGCDISACPSHGGLQCGGRGICDMKVCIDPYYSHHPLSACWTDCEYEY